MCHLRQMLSWPQGHHHLRCSFRPLLCTFMLISTGDLICQICDRSCVRFKSWYSVTTCSRLFSSYFTHIQYKQSQAKKEDSCVPEHGICWGSVRTPAPPSPEGPKHELLGQGVLFVFVESWRAFCDVLHNMSSLNCCFQFKAVTKTS